MTEDRINSGYNSKKVISTYNEMNNLLKSGVKPKKITSTDIREAIKKLANSSSSEEVTSGTKAEPKLDNAENKAASTAEEDSEATWDYSGNRTSSSGNKRYHLGDRIANTRRIDVDSVMGGSTGKTKPIKIGNTTINIPVKDAPTTSNYSNTTDGYIGDSAQAKRGDCYLLAEINSIRNTKEGQALLKKNCKKNKDGSYTVTLPGAQAIRQSYGANGNCQVTGTYSISKEALEKAGASNKYSNGDLEVVAFELAMEAYRAEMVQTNKANGDNRWNDTTAQGTVVGKRDTDYLSGGFMWDAGFILTGQKSEVFSANKNRYNSVTPYKAGQYGFITREEMAKRSGADISMYQKNKVSAAATSTVSSYTKNEQAIDNMLNKYQGKEGQYALSFSVRVAKNGPDGTTKAGGGHALSVLKITGDTVYVSNPWYPDKVEPIPRNEFVKMCTGMQAMPVSASASNSNTSDEFTIRKTNSLLDFIKKTK